MKKVLIAAHAHLADGVKSILEMLLGTAEGISFINAYTDNICLEDELDAFIKSISEKDQGIIFTDICGGSVNQKAVQSLCASGRNLIVITGFNLAAVIEIVMEKDHMAVSAIEDVLSRARMEMKVMGCENIGKAETKEDFFEEVN